MDYPPPPASPRIPTPVPSGRIMAVVMLASDEARFVTGAYLPVSGGIQML